MDYPDYSVGGGENDEFADEIGYSCYKLFEGDTVGRRCKRDLLFYGILYLLFGISLIVISNLEDQSYYFTVQIFVAKTGYYFQGTRWLISLVNFINGLVYFVGLKFWFTLTSNRVLFGFILKGFQLYHFILFVIECWCTVSLFICYSSVKLSQYPNNILIQPLFVATAVFLVVCILITMFHMVAISNHLDDVKKGGIIREPDEAIDADAWDLTDFDAETYFCYDIYRAEDYIHRNIVVPIQEFQYMDVYVTLKYIIIFPINFVYKQCETEEEAQYRARTTPLHRTRCQKWIKYCSFCFINIIKSFQRFFDRKEEKYAVNNLDGKDVQISSSYSGVRHRNNQIYPVLHDDVEHGNIISSERIITYREQHVLAAPPLSLSTISNTNCNRDNAPLDEDVVHDEKISYEVRKHKLPIENSVSDGNVLYSHMVNKQTLPPIKIEKYSKPAKTQPISMISPRNKEDLDDVMYEKKDDTDNLDGILSDRIIGTKSIVVSNMLPPAKNEEFLKNLSVTQFKSLWMKTNISGSFQCRIESIPAISTFTEHLKKQSFHVVMATKHEDSGYADEEIEIAICNIRISPTDTWFMAKFLISNGDFSCVIKSQNSFDVNLYVEKFCLNKILQIEENNKILV